MGYTIDWYVPQRILLVTYFGTISGDEMVQSLHQSQATVNVIPHDSATKFHVIADNTELNSMPFGLNSLKSAVVNPHPAVGWVCMISRNPIHNLVATAYTQLTRVNLKTFPNRKDALLFLISLDLTLADLIPAADLSSES